MGTIVDGEYKNDGKRIRLVKLLASPGMTAERLRNVQDVLEQALSGEVPREELEQKLEAEGNGLSQLLDFAEEHQGLGGWLSLLIAIIALVYQIASSSASVSETDVGKIVDQKLEQQASPQQRSARFGARAFKLKADQPTSGQTSQNSLCPCKSGKKFKHCHGVKRWSL
ncbi:hypothetical protein AX768_08980 [Burkholderia sp. PAMC 28687]|uniref:SEC-C metal-binding domain-containing protein n=1 Tax=Burkholderia sp. PAMC 28687 TaxID=1795874 RepID=UPI0007834E4C|nr:SEC-C domain-containing protein [Burkholderia sp. PAMC 28687]AMM14206.1 hypothetical protein AX768_08980 [Burkholderia sp. PAMC 28687]